MPFVPGELPDLLSQRFRPGSRQRCLASSHLVAQELLLMALSQPRLARGLLWPGLTLARLLERGLLALPDPSPERWIYEMWVCTPLSR
jgi:hypothetical protein